MSLDPQLPAMPPEKPIPDDPMLGAYQAHYPSNRLRLLLQSGTLYAGPVLLLQATLGTSEGLLIAILLPLAYAGLALALFWFLILHHWNREIILYERGFSYREGSHIALFPYSRILRVQGRAERLRIFGLFPREVYDYRLISDQDEVLRVNNIYVKPRQLTERLERAILRARLPLIQAELARGGSADFGAGLRLSAAGLRLEGHGELAWDDLAAYQAQADALILHSRQTGAWATLDWHDLENTLLLGALLRHYAPRE